MMPWMARVAGHEWWTPVAATHGPTAPHTTTPNDTAHFSMNNITPDPLGSFLWSSNRPEYNDFSGCVQLISPVGVVRINLEVSR